MSQPSDVFELTRTAAHAYGVPKLAAKMGVQPGTLYNKLNNDESCAHHKLTVQDLIHIINITGDTKLLAGLAALFDHAVYRLPDAADVSDDALLDLVNRTQICSGAAHSAMADALADGRVSPQEYALFSAECRDWLSAVLTLKMRFGCLVIKDGRHS